MESNLDKAARNRAMALKLAKAAAQEKDPEVKAILHHHRGRFQMLAKLFEAQARKPKPALNS